MTKYINRFIKTSSAFLLSLALFVAVPVFAAEIFLDAKNQSFAQGEEFLAQVFLNTEKESVNAIEGKVIFPVDLLEIREIRDGNSIINFWIDPVRSCASNGAEKPDSICFSGITPGGLSGPKELLFSIVFRAKKEGNGAIQTDGLMVLRNDGKGTPANVKVFPLQFSISQKSSSTSPAFESIKDTELPEDFNPTIESDPNIFDGKYFLVFATQDKGSGIDHYEVREGEWGWFKVAESPYLLKHQSLDKKIFVKTIDKVGNERITVLNAQHQVPWYRQYAVLGILLVIVIALFLLKKLWSRFIQ